MLSPSKLFGAVCALLAVSSAAEDFNVAERQLFPGIGPNQGKIVAPHGLWNNMFVRYAKYTSQMYRYILGCSDPPPYGAKVVDFFNMKSTSTQAVLYRNDHSREFILVFPGTSSEEDAVTDKQRFVMRPLKVSGVSNKDCRACRVHHGFQDAWLSIEKNATSSLSSHMAGHRRYSVTIVGHSLGGSLASLATASLKGIGFPVKKTITFGQPRTGNHAYANYIDKITRAKEHGHGSFYRLTHDNDDVPHHPSKSLGYHHHSTEFWETDDKKGKQSAGNTYMCFGQESKDCNAATKAKFFIMPAHLTYSNQNLNVFQDCHQK